MRRFREHKRIEHRFAGIFDKKHEMMSETELRIRKKTYFKAADLLREHKAKLASSKEIDERRLLDDAKLRHAVGKFTGIAEKGNDFISEFDDFKLGLPPGKLSVASTLFSLGLHHFRVGEFSSHLARYSVEDVLSEHEWSGLETKEREGVIDLIADVFEGEAHNLMRAHKMYGYRKLTPKVPKDLAKMGYKQLLKAARKARKENDYVIPFIKDIKSPEAIALAKELSRAELMKQERKRS